MRDAKNVQARLAALLQATQAVNSSLDLDHVLREIVQQAAALSAAPVVRLFLLDDESQLLRCRVGVGFPLEAEPDLAIPVGASLSGRVAVTGEPLAVADTREDPRTYYPAHVSKYGVVSYLGLPVKFQARLFGVLVFNTPAPRSYTKAEIASLSAFVQQAALAIQNARLYANTLSELMDRRRTEETLAARTLQLDAIRVLTAEITRELDLPTLLALILRRAMEVLGADGGSVYLWDEASRTLIPRAWHNLPEAVAALSIGLGEGLSGVVAERRTGVIVNDYRTSSYTHPRFLAKTTVTAALAEPLVYHDRLVGVIVLNQQRAEGAFTEADRELLALLAPHAAIVVENARLYSEIRQHAATLEARVRERTAELEDAVRVKSEFLAMMSHELRTPLNAVLGFSQLLLERGSGDLTSKQEQFLRQVHSSGNHLLGLVDDILDLSEIETSKIRLSLEPVLLEPLVREVVELIRVPADQKRLAIGTALDPELPRVVADRGKLRRILSKLLQNAVKFTPEAGRITVTTRQASGLDREGTEGQGGTGTSSPPFPRSPACQQFIEIAVADTGIGIAPEDLGRIFSLFQQADSSGTRTHGGAGVGLALARTLVELHGGRVWAESAGPGTGARFVVRLPPLQAPPPPRILLVEDDVLMLKALSLFLRDVGYAVEGMGTGREALRAIDTQRPDLLILDIGLPDMTGWEILKQVRSRDSTHDLPVLVLTELGQDHADQANGLGADEFLSKPVSPRVVTKVVQDLLTGRKRHGMPRMDEPQD